MFFVVYLLFLLFGKYNVFILLLSVYLNKLFKISFHFSHFVEISLAHGDGGCGNYLLDKDERHHVYRHLDGTDPVPPYAGLFYLL